MTFHSSWADHFKVVSEELYPCLKTGVKRKGRPQVFCYRTGYKSWQLIWFGEEEGEVKIVRLPASLACVACSDIHILHLIPSMNLLKSCLSFSFFKESVYWIPILVFQLRMYVYSNILLPCSVLEFQFSTAMVNSPLEFIIVLRSIRIPSTNSAFSSPRYAMLCF